MRKIIVLKSMYLNSSDLVPEFKWRIGFVFCFYSPNDSTFKVPYEFLWPVFVISVE